MSDHVHIGKDEAVNGDVVRGYIHMQTMLAEIAKLDFDVGKIVRHMEAREIFVLYWFVKEYRNV